MSGYVNAIKSNTKPEEIILEGDVPPDGRLLVLSRYAEYLTKIHDMEIEESIPQSVMMHMLFVGTKPQMPTATSAIMVMLWGPTMMKPELALDACQKGLPFVFYLTSLHKTDPVHVKITLRGRKIVSDNEKPYSEVVS